MKKSRNWTFFVLVLAVAAVCVAVFAATAGAASKAKAEELIAGITDPSLGSQLSLEQVQKDVKTFEKRKIDINCLGIHSINEEGRVVYSYAEEGDNVVDYLDTWTDDEGATYIRFQEEERENILCFRRDGSIAVNGVEIEVE